MNAARQHTDQTDSRETFDSLEAKLAQARHRSPSVQMSSAEARARALTAANTTRSRCTDCPCDGMGAVAAAVLIALGCVIGAGVVLIVKGLA